MLTFSQLKKKRTISKNASNMVPFPSDFLALEGSVCKYRINFTRYYLLVDHKKKNNHCKSIHILLCSESNNFINEWVLFG